MEDLANSKNPQHDNDSASKDNLREKQQIELSQPSLKVSTLNSASSTTSIDGDAIPQVLVEEVSHPIADVNLSIFRAYDIKGTVGSSLNADIAELIGLALGSELQERGQRSIIVAQDGRISSPELTQALQQGLIGSGCNVINIGAVTTGILYYACHELETHNGIMVTGSHKASDINGFKIVVNQQTMVKEQLMSLYHRIKRQEFHHGHGQLEQRDMGSAYLQRIQGDIQLSRPLKVVLDLSLIHI